MPDGIKKGMPQSTILFGTIMLKALVSMNGFSGNRERMRKHMDKKTKSLAMLLWLIMAILMTACGGGFTGNPAIFH